MSVSALTTGADHLAPLTSPPVLRVLSLGAGVQSSVLLLLAAEGHLPGLDLAIFADTGWEPRSVYEHLDRIEREIAEPAGIPILRVSSGSIRDDALDPAKRFASMPLHILNPDGGEGMSRRQCTGQYKIRPIKEKVRELLGYPHPQRIPAGVFVEQWIGISTDEFHRAKDADVAYMKNRFPLIEQGFSRSDCLRLLRSRGFGSTPKSSCLGCPYHGNAQWRALRDGSPEEWREVVEFDAAIRAGNARATAEGTPLLGQAYLHRSRRPLDEAPIDRVTAHEWSGRQGDIFDAIADAELENGEADGCSPWSCRSGVPDRVDFALTA
ncbi:adenine nucleotide alpha hydrolase family protein [Streptomyces acidiscabies]|uniref:phosphoadenosine phosphosulfate reductase family protein n=1 Tax=Streptomyces acidiscabies TaxID=42234 RepID=UPI000ADEFED4|nr:phosphoadenosine phosphosulfate reductase family protein [Streptomyces acidiscabies]